MILSKLILGIVKLSNPTKEEIASILMRSVDTADNLETEIQAFELFERRFKDKCREKRLEAEFLKDTVDCFLPIEKTIHPLYDMEVNFENVKPC